MRSVNIHEAKTELSRLLKRVERGEEIVIARAGVPIARLVPLDARRDTPRLGLDEGRFVVPCDFNETPGEVVDAFEGV